MESRWFDLFDIALSILEQTDRKIGLKTDWSFGGGTALMLQIDHRDSYDVDIFIHDPQLLPYLNPDSQDHLLKISPSGYHSDGSHCLKIAFAGIGEIDFICSPPLLRDGVIRTAVRGEMVDLETPAEIIAKKIYHRGSRLQPRDMFDIAAALQHNGAQPLIAALKPFPDQVTQALRVAQGYRQNLLTPVLADLNVKPGYAALRQTAQEDTVRLLRTVLD